MHSVAKHSYIKGASGKSRAKAHVNYIQHRPGPDRGEKPREFFSQDRDDINGLEVKQDIEHIRRAPVVVHKMILSPGCDNVDMKSYTREILQQVGREKGLDLDWRAVVHSNTDHEHAHVVIFGKDLNGRQVRFDRDDYKRLRQAGDRYLEREHYFERFRDRQVERLLKEPTYKREGDWDFQTLIQEINRKEDLIKAPAKELGKDARSRKKQSKAVRDIEEHRKLDQDLNVSYSRQPDSLRPKGRKQRLHESRGRLDKDHGLYTGSLEQKRLKQLIEKFPEKRQELEIQLDEIKQINREQLQMGQGWKNFDALLGKDWKSVDHNQEIQRQSDRPAKRTRRDDDSAREPT